MRTVKMSFEEVVFRPSKTGICPVCGQKATRSTKLYQTINPFNKTADGRQKTRSQIYAELAEKAAEWKAKPTFHARCEG